MHNSDSNRPVKYKVSNERKLIKDFTKIVFTDKQLRHLGIVREQLKNGFCEIAARCNAALLLKLRSDPTEFRVNELSIIGSMASQRMLELEKTGQEQQPVDWSKFSSDAFGLTSTEQPKLSDSNKSVDV